MIYTCKNSSGNNKPDLGPTIQGMGIDIPKAIEEKAVVSGATDLDYNGLSELKDIGVRFCDDFDYILAQRSLVNRASQPNSNEKEGSQM